MGPVRDSNSPAGAARRRRPSRVQGSRSRGRRWRRRRRCGGFERQETFFDRAELRFQSLEILAEAGAFRGSRIGRNLREHWRCAEQHESSDPQTEFSLQRITIYHFNVVYFEQSKHEFGLLSMNLRKWRWCSERKKSGFATNRRGRVRARGAVRLPTSLRDPGRPTSRGPCRCDRPRRRFHRA